MFLSKELKNSYVKVMVYVAVVILIIWYSYARMIDMTIGDAEWYQRIGEACFSDSAFDITLFPKTFRGCLFPLYLQMLEHSVFSVRLGWAITTGVMVATLFFFVLPFLFKQKKACTSWNIRGCLLVLLFLLIFGDSVAYTLSDLFATFFLLSGISVLLLLKNIDKENRFKMLSLSVLTGFLFYVSYNTRAAYLYGFLFALLIFVISIRKSWIKMIICVVGIVVGVFITSIPQCIVNQVQEGKFSPRVFTENYSLIYGDAVDLQMQQIEWGLNYTRYEAYLGG